MGPRCGAVGCPSSPQPPSGSWRFPPTEGFRRRLVVSGKPHQITRRCKLSGGRRWQDGRMTRRDRGGAPSDEWVRMYRDGLTAHRFAALTGTPASTVGYHLRLARSADPRLADAHAGARTSTSRVTSLGRSRMRQLVDLVQTTGRYPSWHAGSTEERTLAIWLQRRRGDARAGRLPDEYKDGLAVLPGWERPSRAEADDQRWLARLEALAAYRAAGNNWPRHKATITGEEHDLGVWLHGQRSNLRQGHLGPDKEAALDEAVTGWRAGRKRGRPASPIANPEA